MHTMCTKVKRSLKDHMSDLMTINVLGKSLWIGNEIPLVRSWLNGKRRLAIGTRAQQESTKVL